MGFEGVLQVVCSMIYEFYMEFYKNNKILRPRIVKGPIIIGHYDIGYFGGASQNESCGARVVIIYSHLLKFSFYGWDGVTGIIYRLN